MRSNGPTTRSEPATPVPPAGPERWLDRLQRMREGTAPPAPIAETLDFHLVEVEPGRAVFEGYPSPRAYNLQGTVHGGWIAAILDSALGCAIASGLPAGTSCTTTELSIRYVRPLRSESGPMRAEGRVVHAGRRLATAEGRLFGVRDGKLYAHAATSCLILPLEAEPAGAQAAGEASNAAGSTA